jgi:type I restriction enzyme S subunit
MNNLILGVNTALQVDWTWKRADGLFRLPNRQVIPTDLGDVVFHYSIPAIQETGDGAVELTSEIKSNKHQLDGGELLVSKLNPRKGCVILSQKHDHPTVASTEFVVLAPKLVDPDFAVFLYQSHQVRESISSVVQSVTRSHQRANPSDITKLWLPIPPLPTQRRIATYLDRETRHIDSLIASKEELLRLLEEKRASLISHAVTRGLNPKAKLKPSGIPWLGDVPEHWTLKPFRHVVTITSGQVDPRSDALKDAILIAPNHIESGTGRLIGTETAAEQGAISGKYSVRKGEVIYSKIRPELRKACLAPYNCLCSADMYPMRTSDQLLPKFLLYFLLGEAFSRLVVLESMRVAMPKVNREMLAPCPIPIAPVAEQNEIVQTLSKTITAIDSTTTDIQTSITLLREKRGSLISAAVTGEMVVR